MHILVLQPTTPAHTEARRADGVTLAGNAAVLLSHLPSANPGMRFDIKCDDTTLEIPSHPSKYIRHAMVRNYMLDTYLRPEHTHVLWIDSDLIDYPANIPTLLHEANPDGITAPLVLLDKCGPRFYDIGGFIEQGRRANLAPPYFQQEGAVVELDSVGCLYMVPAWLYQGGVRYAPPATDYYVEHWSVMQQAKRKGVRVCALTDVVVRHAWLPEFGLTLN